MTPQRPYRSTKLSDRDIPTKELQRREQACRRSGLVIAANALVAALAQRNKFNGKNTVHP